MATLHSYDYELQKDTTINENPSVEDVINYLKNGDVTLTEALRWCRDSGISILDFRKSLEEVK